MSSRKVATPRRRVSGTVAVILGVPALLAGCVPTSEPAPPFPNAQDPTNGGAAYIGAAACRSCHADLVALESLHGHTHALKGVRGRAPSFPPGATRAVVPQPPAGFAWTDVSYVLGGYTHNALFVDSDGFFITDGTAGVNAQWLLDLPPVGQAAGFAPFREAVTEPQRFSFECFRCHTTGPLKETASFPFNQDSRPGIEGTWIEAGVQCEACHGPGSLHAPNPEARDMFVDSSVELCARCHLDGADPTVIRVKNGFLSANTQVAELRASGGHSDFDCGFCHDPHASTTYDRANGIRNECVACHADVDLAGHDGVTFTRGTYSEPMSCESCHMPFGGLSGVPAPVSAVGGTAHVGTVRSHIFRIDAGNADFASQVSGGVYQTDAEGRAAITLDVVCGRCHGQGVTEENNGFPLPLDLLPRIAPTLHSSATP